VKAYGHGTEQPCSPPAEERRLCGFNPKHRQRKQGESIDESTCKLREADIFVSRGFFHSFDGVTHCQMFSFCPS